MFVATRTIRHASQDGKLVAFAPGDVVEGFESWDYAVQRNLVQWGDVRVATPRTVAMVAEQIEKLPVKAQSSFVCPHCPDASIASERGLKIHMSRVHATKSLA